MIPTDSQTKLPQIVLFCDQKLGYLRTLQDAMRAGALEIEIPLVITPEPVAPKNMPNKNNAPKQKPGKKFQKPARSPMLTPTLLSLPPTSTDEANLETVLSAMSRHELSWIILADWYNNLAEPPPILSYLVDAYPYRVLRVQPASPNQFFAAAIAETSLEGQGDPMLDSVLDPLTDPITSSLAAFQAKEIERTGATIYMLTADEYDSGIVLDTKDALIYKQDTPATLANRVHQAGQQVLVTSLQRLIDGD